MLSNIEWALFVYEEFLLEIEINLGLEEDKHVPHPGPLETVKNQPGTMKNHENPPKTIRNREKPT